MNNKILPAGIAVSILGLSNAVFAESVDVHFTGTIENVCSISNEGDGALVKSPLNPNRITSTPLHGGTMGIVEVFCAGTGTLSVGSPTADEMLGGPYGAGIWDDPTAGNQVANDPNQDGNTHTHPANSTSTYYVNMFDTTNLPHVPPGDYDYTVEVTITPD